MNILKYLKHVYEDFTHIDRDDEDDAVGGVDRINKTDGCLRKLQGLNFMGTDLPSYDDINIQQLYLLRYAYAYSYEYKQIYLRVLNQVTDRQQISVTSVGCGTMIDYWSLVQALEEEERNNCRIQYVGIDEIEWNARYRFDRLDGLDGQDRLDVLDRRDGDDVEFQKKCVKDYLEERESLGQRFNSDVYFFPKSISEISPSELDKIIDALAVCEKDKFFVCATLRELEENLEEDNEKMQRIVEALRNRGFTTGMDDADGDFRRLEGNPDDEYGYINQCGEPGHRYGKYPPNIKDYLKALNTNCRRYGNPPNNCGMDCDKCKEYLNRLPMMTITSSRFRVISFERRRDN